MYSISNIPLTSPQKSFPIDSQDSLDIKKECNKITQKGGNIEGGHAPTKDEY